MGFTNKNIEKLRKLGRKIVLPIDEIKSILESKINFSKVENVIDFGAGTLLWSEYFANKVTGGVIARDRIYETYLPKIQSSKIKIQTDLNEVRIKPDLFFASDVLHHISQIDSIQLLQSINAKYIVIKDINANYKFGNFANRMHDLIINHEKIRDIYPNVIEKLLQKKGYSIEIFHIPKLWYPHFLLIGVRDEKRVQKR